MKKDCGGFSGYMRLILALLVVPMLMSCSAKGSQETQTKTDGVPPMPQVVRAPVVAGQFYPGVKKDLDAMIQGFLDNADIVEAPAEGTTVRGIIAPHAGYQFSGQTAGWAYRQVMSGDFDKVLILGPSHAGRFRGAALTNATHFETPLGLVQVDTSAQSLLSNPLFSIQDAAESREHSIEVQVPFIQTLLPDARLIPVMIGYDTSYDDLAAIAKSLTPFMDSKTLIVVSSDFTHFGPNYGYVPFDSNIPENIKKLDADAVEYIARNDSKGLYDYKSRTGVTICGIWPIIVAMEIIKARHPDAVGQPLSYDTSGRMLNDWRNSVSYQSFAWYSEAGLDKDRASLLRLARKSIEDRFAGRETEFDQDSASDMMLRNSGCFVTLTIGGQLRGCIGDILGAMPLHQCVITNARNAAFRDPRFHPLTEAELAKVEIEISILSEPKPLDAGGEAAVLAAIRPNVDGVILERGYSRSVYLPQVWEQLPGKEEFLGHLCQKAGMETECWQDTKTTIYTYQAEYFNEREM